MAPDWKKCKGCLGEFLVVDENGLCAGCAGWSKPQGIDSGKPSAIVEDDYDFKSRAAGEDDDA